MSGTLDIWKILWESGLIVKLVLLILFLASLLSWAIIFAKMKTIKSMKEKMRQFAYNFEILNGKISEESFILEEHPLSQMCISGLNEIQKIKADSQSFETYLNRFGVDGIERALKKGANLGNIELSSGLSLLASIGSVAPFIGLFGTVWGIINSFTGLSSGGATLESVAPGIAEALVATAVGLAAAIPAVLFYNKFSQDISVMNLEMESFGEEFINKVQREFAGTLAKK